MREELLIIGRFPRRWKVARLILLKKKWDGAYRDPSTYRPICILDKAGKLLERVMARRIVFHFNTARDLSAYQFRFREVGKATCDAIMHLPSRIAEKDGQQWQSA